MKQKSVFVALLALLALVQVSLAHENLPLTASACQTIPFANQTMCAKCCHQFAVDPKSGSAKCECQGPELYDEGDDVEEDDDFGEGGDDEGDVDEGDVDVEEGLEEEAESVARR